ncbi:hypothetical protein MKX03_020645 [Papaver bracteatum]|nr:hypothetical protein MKX03_020645 [Papaver bracteatum]
MGAPKQKWTAEEEKALIAGINKHGAGKWKNIQNDPEFSDVLAARSNIDMKDKWRNMSATATGEGSRPKGAKAKATTPKVPKMTPSSSQPTTEDAAKNTPRYDAMILEALSNITDPNGADTCFINDFIEVQNYYKIKKDPTFGTRAQTPKPKDSRKMQSQPQDSRFHDSTLFMAQKIAEAEYKSFMASVAVKEAERAEGMAEESACMKQFFEDILEQCKRGEPVIMAF